MVKLYADEDGHEAVRGLEAIVVSALARIEVAAAIWRKQRLGELAADDARLLIGAFEADYHGTGASRPRFAAIEVSAAVLEIAADLVAVHGLRAYDGVQLAGALAARAADPFCKTFVASDGALRHADALTDSCLRPRPAAKCRERGRARAN